MGLQNKNIVVTGAASGIGAETAKILKAAGAQVIGLDINSPKDHVDRYIAADFADAGSIETAAREVGGDIDAICNIAGLAPTRGRVAVLNVNVLGVRRFTEAMIDNLNDGASIVNMASLAGFEWVKSTDAIKQFLKIDNIDEIDAFCEDHDIDDTRSYFFSKETLRVWTMKNCMRWKDRGIRINTVAPGPVDTPLLVDFIATLGKRAEEDLKRNRPGTVEEIAPIVAFLCDPSSSWINGANIPADGGVHASLMCEIHDL